MASRFFCFRVKLSMALAALRTVTSMDRVIRKKIGSEPNRERGRFFFRAFLRYPDLPMTKKLLIIGILAGCSHVAFAAPQTFEEALQSLTEKTNREDLFALLKDADKTLALAGTDEQKAQVRSRIGDANFNWGKIEAARQQYQEILKLPGLDAAMKSTTLIKIGTTYQFRQPHDYVKARATFQRIVDGKEFSVQDKVTARLQIAATYGQAGDDATARKRYESIAQDDELTVWAHFAAFQSLAEMDARQKNYGAARENYEKLAGLAPTDMTFEAIALDGIAESYFEEKNFAQARQKFTEILKLDVTKAAEFNRSSLETLQAGAQMGIAKTYASEGDKKRARAEFTKVLQMTAAKTFADQVRYELERLNEKPPLAQ